MSGGSKKTQESKNVSQIPNMARDTLIPGMELRICNMERDPNIWWMYKCWIVLPFLAMH